MKKILYIFLITTYVLGVSCADFLDERPETGIPDEGSITTLNEAYQHLTGIYSAMLSSSLWSGTLTQIPDLQCDLFYAVTGFNNTYGYFYRWDMTPTAPELESIYSGLYALASRANFFLDNSQPLLDEFVARGDDDSYNRLYTYRGEAHMIRALCFSELIKLFCDAYDPDDAQNQLGIVISTTYSNAAGMIPRSSLEDSYRQVLDDLEAADTLIRKHPSYENIYNVANSAYASVGAVNSLRARVYLNMRDWENAIKYSTEVIEMGTYELTNGVNSNVLGENELYLLWWYDSGTEVIWKVGMTSTVYGGSLSKIFLGYDYVSFYPDYIPAQWLIDTYASSTDVRQSVYYEYSTTGYAYGLTTYLLMKYNSNPNIDAGGTEKWINMPKIFRLAEQYLIRAEANCMLGYETEANEDITALRKKRIFNYGNSNHRGDELLQQIKIERAKELVMEGFRLQDLKRWGDGFSRTPQNGSLSGPDDIIIYPDNVRFTWPIPQHEIDANAGVVLPNPSNS